MTSDSKRSRTVGKRRTTIENSERTERTLAWRKSKLEEGHKRQETFFEVKTLAKLKKFAKDQETTVAGLIRKIVEDWLRLQK